MNSLAGIQRQNEINQAWKYQQRARAMNSTESHPKKAAPCKRTSLGARLKSTPVGACPALDKLR